MAGQGTPATVLLAARGITHSIHSYDVSPDTPNYGAAVATALGVPAERVFKTLVTAVDGGLTVAVVPVIGELDLKALAGAVGGKRAVLAERSLAERTTGYIRGGISPLGQRRRLPTVLDSSAMDHARIFVSAGRRGLQLQLSPGDMVALTEAVIARIAVG